MVCERYGPPDVLQFKEVEKPAPKDNEVLIRIHAAVVSAADCAARKGDTFLTRLAFGLFKPRATILGTEFAGEIEEIGKDVTLFRTGDQIYAATGTAFGAHAEYICLPEDGAIALKPANVIFEEAAALCEGALTVLPFLRDKAHIQRGQEILINGASGNVGCSAVQFARYFGAKVTGVCSTANVELVKSLGASKIIDYTKEDFTQTGQIYDIIFDAVGKSSFSRCRDSLKRDGIYLTTVPSPGAVFQMMWTSAKIGGKQAILTFTGLRPPGEKKKDLDFLRKLVESGEIKPVIDRRYSLDQAAEAHRYVDTGHKKGNVVVTM